MENEKTNFDFKIYFEPAFVICTVVLALAVVTQTVGVKSLGVHLEKDYLPLRKSLELLNEGALLPFKVVSKSRIDNPEILKSLGTEDYIQWVIEDTEGGDDDPAKIFLLFVTYYGLPDRVPHVPEECYTGGGFEKKQSSDVMLAIKGSDFEKSIAGKYLLFGSINSLSLTGPKQFPVLYFFKVNGEYANSREKARFLLNNNLFSKTAYFCKVELVFNRSFLPPDKQQVVGAGEKILSKLLPLLENKYWPEW